MVQPQRQSIVPLPPRPRPPPLTLRGRIVYHVGRYPYLRPARLHVNVAFKTRDLRHPGIVSGNGDAVDTDHDGRFTIATFVGVPSGEGRPFLELFDYYTELTYKYELNGSVNLGSPVPQDLGDMSVPWKPPRPEVAWLNNVQIMDSAELARKLCALLQFPASRQMPFVDLWRETDVDGSVTYTRAQMFFDVLAHNQQPTDFSSLVADQLVRSTGLPSSSTDTPSTTVVRALKMLGGLSGDAIYSHPLTGQVLVAVGKVLGSPFSAGLLVEDPPVDMAAAATLLFVAGVMAQQPSVKPVVYFNTLTDNQRMLHRWLRIHVRFANTP